MMMTLLAANLLLNGCNTVTPAIISSKSKDPRYDAAEDCSKWCRTKYDTNFIGCTTNAEGTLKECFCE